MHSKTPDKGLDNRIFDKKVVNRLAGLFIAEVI